MSSLRWNNTTGASVARWPSQFTARVSPQACGKTARRTIWKTWRRVGTCIAMRIEPARIDADS
eukprot:9437615-Pyramimonas_sp.AAC.1